ncbi:hypothetical protein BH11CYA1_BH11CYA1_27140 [soil metagenome]
MGERMLSKFKDRVVVIMPDKKLSTRSFWIRFGALSFFAGSYLFLWSLKPIMDRGLFAILLPAYSIFVLLGYTRLRAIEMAKAASTGGQSELVMRRIELTVAIVAAVVSITGMYLTGPWFNKFVILPLCIIVGWWGFCPSGEKSSEPASLTGEKEDQDIEVICCE